MINTLHISQSHTPLADTTVRTLLAEAFDTNVYRGQRVLVIIPDTTRSAPIPLVFAALCDTLAAQVTRLDFLIALGTHPPHDAPTIARLVGVAADAYPPNVDVFNHRWNDPAQLAVLDTIPADEIHVLSEGLLHAAVPVEINRAILEYDQIIICGPVFPHEVAGFSGGAKYFFPGIAGPQIIDATHWLGALSTSMATIGVQDTAVRRVIQRAAQAVPRPVQCIALVMRGSTLHGVYIGAHADAWRAAATHSAQLNIVRVAQPYTHVLAMASTRYADLWTAAKAMYKTEPVVADGGEVIIYAPHITEVSYTHGALLDTVGYHVRDYFVKQWDRFGHVPGGVLAHSTHVKGHGSYDATRGIETPRINVILATGISAARCAHINLGYADYRAINLADWEGQAERLLVRNAGEVLYRLAET